jgi:hypothetical protein
MEIPYGDSITEPEDAYDYFHPADDVNEFTGAPPWPAYT